ncbi:MAG: hypothetical protein R3C60_06060 [Parvularculaceae bacterium]
MRVRVFAVIAATVAATPPGASAKFSKEWSDSAAEIKAGCAAFAKTLPAPQFPLPQTAEPREALSYPRGAPQRPHVCLFFKFDIDADGAAQNIELVYKGPDNLNFVFGRSARKTIGKWRFLLPEEFKEGYQGAYVEVTYDPVRRHYYQWGAYDFPNAAN